MLSQANDFYQESEYIYSILENLSNNDFRKVTQFKSWTFNTIIRHLHVWNYASYLSLEGEDNWKKFREKLNFFFSKNKTLKDFEKKLIIPNKRLIKARFNRITTGVAHANPQKTT